MADAKTPEVLPPAAAPGARATRGGSAFFWRFGAAWRLLRDRQAKGWEKLLLLAAVAYVVFPLDFMPDLAPVIGWIDDIGIAALAMGVLHKALERYRT